MPRELDLDEFDDFLEDQRRDPEFVAAYEDAASRSRLVKDLVDCRRAQRLTQSQIARHMSVGQSVVSEFETSSTDAYFSTLQRYARAIGARIRVEIELPADQEWAGHVRSGYSAPKFVTAPTRLERREGGLLQNWAHEVESRAKEVA